MEQTNYIDRVTVVHTNKEGKVVGMYISNTTLFDRILIKLGIKPHNSMTDAGLAGIAAIILTDVGGTAWDYIAIGTGTVSPSTADTALGTEVSRKAGTGTRVQTTAPNDTSKLYTAFSSADGLSGTSTISEIGMLNASSNGTLLMRSTFPGEIMQWDSGDTLSCTITIQCKQGS